LKQEKGTALAMGACAISMAVDEDADPEGALSPA